MALREEISALQTNIARLMVRRHLKSFLDMGVQEDHLIEVFRLVVKANPDMKMKDVAKTVERMINERVAEYTS